MLDEREGDAKKKIAHTEEKAHALKSAKKRAHSTDLNESSNELPIPKEDHAPSATDPRRLGKHRNQQNADRKELHEKKGFVKTFFNRKSGS